MEKERLILSYESVSLKIFMDQTRVMQIYGKNVCVSPGIQKNLGILLQVFGNLGAIPGTTYDETTDIILFSNQLLEDLNSRKQIYFIQQLEEDINLNRMAYRNLLFASEKWFINYLTQGYTNDIRELRELKKEIQEKDEYVVDVSEIEQRIIINQNEKETLSLYKKSAHQDKLQTSFLN
jgi:hypothetical protein